MAYGIIIYNPNGNSIVDTRTDKQSTAMVSGSASITTDSSGDGTSSSISFPGLTSGNSSTHNVYIYKTNTTQDIRISINRSTDSFTIGLSEATPSTTFSIPFSGTVV